MHTFIDIKAFITKFIFVKFVDYYYFLIIKFVQPCKLKPVDDKHISQITPCV